MADIATQNQPFEALVASVIPFQANPSHFLADFDSLVASTTHLGAQNSRSGRFRVNDDDDNDDNRRTKRLLYPLLRMRARGNKCASSMAINDNLFARTSECINTWLAGFVTHSRVTNMRCYRYCLGG